MVENGTIECAQWHSEILFKFYPYLKKSPVFGNHKIQRSLYTGFTVLDCVAKTSDYHFTCQIVVISLHNMANFCKILIIDTQYLIHEGKISFHYNDASIVYLTICSGANQRKYQSSTPLAFVQRIYQWPVNFLHKGPVTRKIFLFDDIIIISFLVEFQVGDLHSL